jgi:hypothetical protein
MTPEDSPMHEQPTRHSDGVPEVDADVDPRSTDFDSGQEVRRKPENLFSPETQVALDMHLAKSFVENAPLIMSYLANCLVPPVLVQDGQLNDLMQDKEYDFRTRVITERNAVFDIIVRGRDIAEQLKPELTGDCDQDRVSELVSKDLSLLAKDALETVERLKILNSEILDVTNAIRVREFPGKASVEQQIQRQFADMQEYFEFRDEHCIRKPEDFIHRPLNAYGSLWRTVLHEQSEPEQFDANSLVALTAIFEDDINIQVSEEEPVVVSRKDDFNLLVHGTRTHLEESIRAAAREYLSEIGAGNALFEQMKASDFTDSAEFSFLMKLFTVEREKSVAISDTGVLTISSSVAEEILPKLQAQLESIEGFGGVIADVCAHNHINYSVVIDEGEVTLSFEPIVISSSGEGPLEDLKASFGIKRLGLVPTNDLGIPEQDEDPGQEMGPEAEMLARESRLVLLDREISGSRAGASKYVLGFQAAGLMHPEAGEQMNRIAERLDEFMTVFPDSEGVILRKLDLVDRRDRGGEDPQVIMQHRFAQPLSVAYRKGKVDFASFGEAINLFELPDPNAWALSLGKALAGTFSWINDDEVLDIEVVKNADIEKEDESPFRVGIVLDSEALEDDSVIEVLQRMSGKGTFKQLHLQQEALDEVMRGKHDGVFTSVDLLKEVESVLRNVGESAEGTPLSISLQDALLSSGEKRRGLEKSYRLIIHNDEGELVSKGHFKPSEATFFFKEVDPVDMQEFEKCFDRALEYLVSTRELSVATLRRLEKVLSAEGHEFSEGMSSREEIDQIRRSAEPDRLVQPLRKALLKEASIHDIVDALEESGIELDDLESAQLLIKYLGKGVEGSTMKSLVEQLMYRPGVYIENVDDTFVIRKFDDDELKRSGIE